MLILGECCIKTIVSALWYLDPHHDHFRSQSLAIPPCFTKFTGYNDWKRKKEKQPRIQQGDIDRHVQALSSLLCPVPQCDPVYCQIQEKLSSLPLYQTVFVNDYSPSDRYVHKHWLNNLQLEFPVKMYRYSHGNSLGSMTFLWHLPSDSSEDSTSTAKAITCLNSKQKLYHTRQMSRDFLIQYSEFVKAPTCVLRHMFKELVRDSSAAVPTIEQKVDERVAEAIIELQDPEIIMDLRKNNGKVQSSFEDFWSELQKYLDEIITPVNERRHGDTMYLPIAISVHDLHEIASERLTKAFPGEEKPIPSDEWIRLQFWPRNPYTTTSLRYTGRFEVKYAVQARQMRKTHPDCRYVAVILQYMKRFTPQLIRP